MVQNPALLVDDRDLRYICVSYSEVAAKSSYEGTFTTPEAPGFNCTEGWFDYTFYGTGIHVAASALTPIPNYEYWVKLDEGAWRYLLGQGSYFSPSLPDGQHTITYALPLPGLSLPALDYLAVTPGLSTPLQGRTLAVDDSDSSISFSGSWNTTLPAQAFTYMEPPPFYLGTTHWSSSIGDSVQFKFEGSSISVFGVATNISEGDITTSYTLDGVSTISGLPQETVDSTSFVQLFHADVKSGSHSLVINITDIQIPQALGIDLITYNASFNNISSLSPFSSSKPKLDPGSKVGITFGVLAFAAILAGLFLFLRRRYIRPRNPRFRLYDSFETGDKKSTFPLQPGKQTSPL